MRVMSAEERRACRKEVHSREADRFKEACRCVRARGGAAIARTGGPWYNGRRAVDILLRFAKRVQHIVDDPSLH